MITTWIVSKNLGSQLSPTYYTYLTLSKISADILSNQRVLPGLTFVIQGKYYTNKKSIVEMRSVGADLNTTAHKLAEL